MLLRQQAKPDIAPDGDVRFFVLDAEWFADKGCYRDERAKPEEDYLLMQMVSFRFFFATYSAGK
ncbi:hypothetical protein REX01_001676 [Klebsiella aerogenes]|uniref:hypothetical protein n=1 Tax=Klebsiella aerogenes TaxID=548 RepID=UPI000B1C2E97|nr:hypothetical protein [Klebsiella aerogenes]EKZ5662526.1 hypothetical protein [Klebsiella aerogenes]